jgi:tartrate-resistant acid phosphatase type 5
MRLKHCRRRARLVGALLVVAAAAAGWFTYQARIAEPLANVSRELDRQQQIRFIAVGRQGYGNRWASDVASAMGQVAREHPIDFVVLTGDNFYPTGVESVMDPQWQAKFEHLYSARSLSATPFFAVLGNHDHAGNAAAQIAYAAERRGSARWRMRGLQYHQDVGRVGDRVLLRIVFLDTVPMAASWRKRLIGRWYLRKAIALPGSPIWRAVVGHAGVRSATRLPYSTQLVLDELQPLMRELKVDLMLSGNDRFQQVLDSPDEPLHVSTNGGGEKLETGLLDQATDTTFIAVRPGFARVSVDRRTLEVAMMDRYGTVTYRKSRSRHAVATE